MKMPEEKREGTDARGDRTARYDIDLGVSGSWAANGATGALRSAMGKARRRNIVR